MQTRMSILICPEYFIYLFDLNNKHALNSALNFTYRFSIYKHIFQGINIPIPCRTKIKYTTFHLEK